MKKHNALKTLSTIAKENPNRLLAAFSLVMIENLLFLSYPIFAGFSIDSIIAGEMWSALTYALMVLIMWLFGALRRRVDTQIFATLYASLATPVMLNERSAGRDSSTIAARVALSREFVDFFEHHFPTFFTSVVSILGAALMLLFVEFYVGIGCFVALCLLLLAIPKFSATNDRLYLRLNNRLEREVLAIERASEDALKRHYAFVSKARIGISNREALGYLVVGVVASLLFAIAIVIMSLDSERAAGHIYAVITYLWTFAMSLDDAPRLLEEYSKLKDIGKRIDAQSTCKADS
ncbi:MAG: ABC transporter six-transmembrane domain-containing protein [Wolinella sp.]